MNYPFDWLSGSSVRPTPEKRDWSKVQHCVATESGCVITEGGCEIGVGDIRSKYFPVRTAPLTPSAKAGSGRNAPAMASPETVAKIVAYWKQKKTWNFQWGGTMPSPAPLPAAFLTVTEVYDFIVQQLSNAWSNLNYQIFDEYYGSVSSQFCLSATPSDGTQGINGCLSAGGGLILSGYSMVPGVPPPAA